MKSYRPIEEDRDDFSDRSDPMQDELDLSGGGDESDEDFTRSNQVNQQIMDTDDADDLINDEMDYQEMRES